MVKQITLTHTSPFLCVVHTDDKLLCESKNKKSHEINLDSLPAKLKIYIEPYKIQPLIRFDGHLVNYGLAKIKPWDHMLEFTVHENYLDLYFQEIIEAKRQYLSKTGQNIPDNMESYVGVNNAHTDLIDQINQLIK